MPGRPSGKGTGSVGPVSGVRLAARLVLAVIFAFSGGAKALDSKGTREGVIGFGVPSRLALPMAVALPIAEFTTAGLLVWHTTAWWGGLAALVLLAAFSVAIAVNLGRGNRPDCHCFGQIHSAPVSGRMLARNLALAVPAVVLVLVA